MVNMKTNIVNVSYILTYMCYFTYIKILHYMIYLGSSCNKVAICSERFTLLEKININIRLLYNY